MRWKAQQVLWCMPPTIFQLCCATSGCFGPSTLYRWRAGLAAPPGGLRCVLTMPGWSRQSGTHTKLQVCLGLSLQRSTGRSLQPCRQVPWAVQVYMEFEQESAPDPPYRHLCVRTLHLSNEAELGYHCLNSSQLLLSRDSLAHNPQNICDASFWPVECVCLLSDKTKRSEMEVNWKKWQNRKIWINAKDRASQSGTMQNANMQHPWGLDPVKCVGHTWEPALLTK